MDLHVARDGSTPDAPDGVLRCFVVGLPDSYRGRDLENQLSEAGWLFERAEGVLAADLMRGPIVDQDSARAVLGRPLSVPEVGCALAHRRIYRQLLDGPDHAAVVLEDDARAIDELPAPQAISAYLDRSEPVVLQLSFRPGSLLLSRERSSPLQCEPELPPGRRLLRSFATPTTTTAYALNKPAARLLLDDDRAIAYPADWPLRPASHIAFMVCVPPLFRPAETEESTIDVGGARHHTRTSLRLKAAWRWGRLSHLHYWTHSHAYGTYRSYFVAAFARPYAMWRARRSSSDHAESSALERLMQRAWQK